MKTSHLFAIITVAFLSFSGLMLMAAVQVRMDRTAQARHQPIYVAPVPRLSMCADADYTRYSCRDRRVAGSPHCEFHRCLKPGCLTIRRQDQNYFWVSDHLCVDHAMQKNASGG